MSTNVKRTLAYIGKVKQQIPLEPFQLLMNWRWYEIVFSYLVEQLKNEIKLARRTVGRGLRLTNVDLWKGENSPMAPQTSWFFGTCPPASLYFFRRFLRNFSPRCSRLNAIKKLSQLHFVLVCDQLAMHFYLIGHKSRLPKTMFVLNYWGLQGKVPKTVNPCRLRSLKFSNCPIKTSKKGCLRFTDVGIELWDRKIEIWNTQTV